MRWPWHRERRDSQPPEVSWDMLAQVAGQYPFNASPHFAENLSVVFACVQAISSAIASLPVTVYRPDGENRVEDTGNPMTRVVRNGPNVVQSWPDFIEWIVASVLLRGNGLAEIAIDGRGAVTGLNPVPWSMVSPILLPSGRLAFDISELTGIFGTTGNVRRLFADECIYVKDRSDLGLIGRSRLNRAAATVANAAQVQEYSLAMFQNGATPSGVLQSDNRIDPDSMTRLKDAIRERFAGAGNAKKIMVLDQGLKWQSISVSPEDAELLASRRFSTEELSRLFGVPLPIINIWDHSSFTNSETAGRWFAQFTLSPWIVKLEHELSRSVFAGSPSFINFDLGGLLRGDPLQRWQGYDIASRNHILTPNEIRQAEGWNARADGDTFPVVAADLQHPPAGTQLPAA
jgi:HK97 family phage portal protein